MTQLYLDNTLEREYSKEINDICDIQRHLLECIVDQDTKLNRIEENITRSESHMEESVSHLKEANRHYFSYTPIIAGGVLGAALGVPFMTALGLKIGSVIAVSTCTLGSLTGYSVQKL